MAKSIKTPSTEVKSEDALLNESQIQDSEKTLSESETPSTEVKSEDDVKVENLLDGEVHKLAGDDLQVKDQNLQTSDVSVEFKGGHYYQESDVHHGLIQVKIKYPKDWDKEKYFKDGEIKYVSQEVANTFVELGIATII